MKRGEGGEKERRKKEKENLASLPGEMAFTDEHRPNGPKLTLR